MQQAIILLIFVSVIIGITVIQSWRTEKLLSSLKDLSSPKSIVIRDEQEIQIDSRDLVIDDILIIREGDKITADALILETKNLMVDESSLTGESIPVEKSTWSANPIAPNNNQNSNHIVYSGTFVTQGQAYCKVIATGINSELGKIGQSIITSTKNDSPLKKETKIIVNRILIIDCILFLAVMIILTMRYDWIKASLTAITFATAMLPEEIPAVLTIFMALAAWRISRKNVLTRRLPAIETLGSISVLCSDKTGTITTNKMVLREVFNMQTAYEINQEQIPEEFHHLIEYAILASREKTYDPMEKALIATIENNLVDSSHIHKNWTLIKEYPLQTNFFAMSRAWNATNESNFSIYCKGSPEVVYDLCHLNQDQIATIAEQVSKMAEKGLRVLGVAKSKSSITEMPLTQHDIEFEFQGLLGFHDPIRPGVIEAIAECKSAGIKVIMITGDHAITAQNIAKDIGIENYEQHLSGENIDSLSDKELQESVKNIFIFSRVRPEHKLRIVNAFKQNGEVISMTGDGVNDAPALKASDVGIAMGQSGTQVARETADLILLDDNFTSIVSAIRLGRRVFGNLKKALSYILAIHIPIAGLTMVPIIFSGLPIIFFPIHVALLELIVDPTCSIVFESAPEPKNIMNIGPRKLSEPILSRQVIYKSLLQGLSLLIFTLGVYFTTRYLGKSDGEIRCFTFASLLMGNIVLTVANKTWKKESLTKCFKENQALVIIVLMLTIVFSLIVNIASLKKLFYFV
jgi:Ca2+-transporting ATPase